MLKVKEVYFERRSVILNKGYLVRFWIDPWMNNTPFRAITYAL
jgi:hypothetical protein